MLTSYGDPKGTVQDKPLGAVLYGEASYFDGFHFAHIAAWQDHQIRRLREQRAQAQYLVCHPERSKSLR